MKRRDFLKVTGVGLAASTAVAAPAIAQSMPEIKWRLAASWPKALDTLYGGCEYFSQRVAAITDNKFQIQSFAAGEIVPGLQVLDAVSNGTIEMGNTALYYYWGKNPAFTFGTSLPFGLEHPRPHLVAEFRRRHRTAERPLEGVQHHRHSDRLDRRPDGRLVPEGDQVDGGPAGLEIPRRRLRRHHHRQGRRRAVRRSPAATSIRRWRKAPSTPPSGSAPMTTRNSAS